MGKREALLLFDRMEKNSRLVREGYEGLQKQYGDSYIAIDDGKVIASRSSLDSLRGYLRQKKVELTTVVVQYIPKKGTIILY